MIRRRTTEAFFNIRILTKDFDHPDAINWDTREVIEDLVPTQLTPRLQEEPA